MRATKIYEIVMQLFWLLIWAFTIFTIWSILFDHSKILAKILVR